MLPVLFALLSSAAMSADPGGELSVESAPLEGRDAAARLHGQLTDALGESSVYAPRMTRRFYPGEGWRYIVVIEGLSDLKQAEQLAGMADGLSVIAPITPVDGPVATPRLGISGEETTGAQPESHDTTLPSADAVLRAAIRAHGGRTGGTVKLAAAQSVRFSYQRRVPEQDGELRASNTFLRQGDAIRLQVEIAEGTGEDSVTTLTPQRAGWVSTAERTVERDGARTLEILERFAPESILAIPLGLPDDVETAAAWRGLTTSGRRDVGERAVWLLTGAVKTGEVGLREAAFDVDESRLMWVSWSAEHGEVTFYYDDYRELDRELVVPFSTRIEQEGVLIEEISVAQLELNPVLDKELFEPPDNN
ncbi:MAG: hypothetical protein AAFV53_01595 [Myxococcota bacterium]